MEQVSGEVLPLEKVAPKIELMSLTPELKKQCAFMGLRQARCDARNYGRRLKRASEAEEENQAWFRYLLSCDTRIIEILY